MRERERERESNQGIRRKKRSTNMCNRKPKYLLKPKSIVWTNICPAKVYIILIAKVEINTQELKNDFNTLET